MIYSFFNSGLTGITLFVVVIAYAIAVLFSLSMHELAHGFVAYKCGDVTAKAQGRLSLNPFKHIDLLGMISFLFVGFGWAKPVEVNPLNFRNYKRDMFLVAIAGILTNLILAFIFTLLYLLMEKVAGNNMFFTFVYYIFNFSAFINIALAVFNLLPIFPLDGFNAIATYLKYDNKFVQFMQRYGQIILIILIVSGLFGYALSFVTGGLSWLFEAFWHLIV